MDKNSIRKNMRQLREKLTLEQRLLFSEHIAQQIYMLPEFQEASSIYSYVTYKDEVITDTILEYALLQQKKVAVPKVIHNRMDFFYIHGRQDLQTGYQGILEPINENLPALDKEVFLIMPGLGFDKEYNRIGYGGGYYDRYLEEYKDTKYYKVAVAYDFQVLEHIESMDYDKKVDCIITPTRTINKID